MESYRDSLLMDNLDIWLKGRLYRLGYLYGNANKDGPFQGLPQCLTFEWIIYGRDLGIRLSASDHDILFMMNTTLGSDSDPFYHGLANWYDDANFSNLEAVVHHREIEHLVISYFPTARKENEIVECTSKESNQCLSKNGGPAVCEIVGELPVCNRCKKVIEARLANRISSSDPGYVYLIGNTIFNFYKIGLSRTPKKRLTALRTKMPFQVEVVHQIDTPDMGVAETTLQNAFRDKHSNGEWYHLTEEDVSLICSLRSFTGNEFVDKSGNEVFLKEQSDEQ